MEKRVAEKRKEIWKEVKGYKGWYSVSNNGRIRRDASGNGTTSGFILKPNIKNRRYARVLLWKKCKRKEKSVHQLVAETFIKNLKENLQVNHKDGNRFNNCVENLEYITSKLNHEHAVKIGLKSNLVGSNNIKAKLSERDVLFIRNNCTKGNKKEMFESFNITKSSINRILRKDTWRHI